MNLSGILKNYLACLVACAVLFMLIGCENFNNRANIDFSRSNVIYDIEQVERTKPQVYVYPVDDALYPPNALLLPLPMAQSLGPREAEPLSKGLTRIFWQALLREEAFPVIEYAEGMHVYNLSQALALAKYKNADVLITGNIPYMITGGSVGMNQFTVHIEIYDVETAELLWSITHSGLLADKPAQDYLIFKQKTRLPPDPLYTTVTAVGSDIGKILHQWGWAVDDVMPPEGEVSPMQENKNKQLFETPAF